VIGRSPDELSLEERLAFSNRFVALEIYTPATTPLRKIEAIGDTAEECIRQLVERGLDPLQYEFVLLPPPYPG